MGKSRRASKQKAEESPGQERRKQQRFECEGFAEVIVDDAAFLFRGSIQNLSLGGCYIESRAGLHVDRGTEAELHFRLNGDIFRARARIMMVRRGAGVGFEFILDDPEFQKRIGDLIKKLNDVPSPHVVDQTGIVEEGNKYRTGRNLWSTAH